MPNARSWRARLKLGRSGDLRIQPGHAALAADGNVLEDLATHDTDSGEDRAALDSFHANRYHDKVRADSVYRQRREHFYLALTRAPAMLSVILFATEVSAPQ